MNSAMAPRSTRSEAGFALIEVIVSAAVLAIVALAVLSGIDAASSSSGREKARAVAASLAEQDQERLRAMPVDAARRPSPQTPRRHRRRRRPTTSSPRRVDHRRRRRHAGAAATRARPDRVPAHHHDGHVGVVGTRITPVRSTRSSRRATEYSRAPRHARRQGRRPQRRPASPGIAVDARAPSPGYARRPQTTDANGCVVFKQIPVGTYTVTLNTRGLRRHATGDQRSTKTQKVVAGHGHVRDDELRPSRPAPASGQDARAGRRVGDATSSRRRRRKSR